MDGIYTKRDTCRLCGASGLDPVVELAPIPVATPNVDLAATEKVFHGVASARVPLVLYLCPSCGHLQLIHVVNPAVQYRNFRYVTAISRGLPAHFRTMAKEICSQGDVAPGSFVIEIGSNDGTLLGAFKERGMRVLGVDPAERTAWVATEAGIETLPEFFDGTLGRRIAEERGKADVVIANNTFANLDDLDDIVAGVKALMTPGGVFVFETQYGRDVIDNLLVDTIYHEHLSYFMISPLRDFFARTGLELVDVRRIWTKGGSIRGIVQHAGGSRRVTEAVAAMRAAERDEGYLSPARYVDFCTAVASVRARVGEAVERALAGGGTLAGYGASVGSMTLIELFGLGPSLAFIADDKPLGEAIETGDYLIPIRTSDVLYEARPDLVLLFAWRYAKPIVARHERYLKNIGHFLVPLPEVRLI